MCANVSTLFVVWGLWGKAVIAKVDMWRLFGPALVEVRVKITC